MNTNTLDTLEARALYKSHGIVHTFDHAWVHKDTRKKQYVVFRNTATHSESDSAYPLNADGLSIAVARAKYISSRIAARLINS